MEFQSTSLLGDSGDAAAVEDAGTNWFNPAGLVYLPHQVVASAMQLYVPTNFKGTVTAPSPFGPSYSFKETGTSRSYASPTVPAGHYALPFNDQLAFGLSILPAWGLQEDLGNNTVTRYNLTRLYNKSIAVSPSMAMKINEHWALGFGPDMNYFSLQLSNRSRFQGPGLNGDSTSHISADHWGYGYHAGILFNIQPGTRIGLNYRSKIVSDMQGDSDYALTGGSLFFSTNQFKINFILPPSTTLSAYHELNTRWAILGTVVYDQWSVMRQLNAQNYISPLGLSNAPFPQGFHNTFEWGLGARYQWSDHLLLRGAAKFIPSPTITRYRDLSFPDGDKIGLYAGARYVLSKKLSFDFVYSHVFVKQTTINNTNPLTGVVTSGNINTSIDIAGAQVVYTI